MKIVQKSITELKSYSNNPRKNDQAVEAVAASIREFGFKVPIVITPEMEIIAGHTRLKATESLGLKKVPCIIADDLSPEQIKAFRLADNKTAELAEWDTDLLMQELADLSDFDMSEYGFDLSAFGEEPAAGEIDANEFDDTPPEEPRTQRGEVWELGDHRLMCGDSSSDDLETLMGGAKDTSSLPIRLMVFQSATKTKC